MDETLTIEPGEMEPDALLEALEGGRRVVIQLEFLGGDHEVTLRYDGDIYYCDTPTRLHKHRSADEMRTCLEQQGYASLE